MAKTWNKTAVIKHVKKGSSIGSGGRGRSTKINTGTMNKHKKRSWKKYRGQGK